MSLQIFATVRRKIGRAEGRNADGSAYLAERATRRVGREKQMGKNSRTGAADERREAKRAGSGVIGASATQPKRAAAAKAATIASHEPPSDFAERTADLILRTTSIAAKA